MYAGGKVAHDDGVKNLMMERGGIFCRQQSTQLEFYGKTTMSVDAAILNLYVDTMINSRFLNF